MSDHQDVIVQSSADELAASTADRTTALLAAAISARGVAHLVVTGGGILEQVLAALAPRAEALSWGQVHVWWGDERFVPADSDDRNDRPAMTKLFDLVPVDPAKLHRMPNSDDYASGPEAADAYEALLDEVGGGSTPAFDVVLLGIGPDGHCASLFPGASELAVTGRAVTAVHESAKPPPDRLSLTFDGLGAAREVWFIASGDGKADAVAGGVGGDQSMPAARVRAREKVLWLVDEAAAGKLP